MSNIMDYTANELEKLRRDLLVKYEGYKRDNLKLDLSRGKPATSQLDLSNELLQGLECHYTKEDADARNYGILTGITECKDLFANLLGLQSNQIIIGGNSSLNMMYDNMIRLCMFGTKGEKPWRQQEYEGKTIKFLCPVPGYDRHFTICESLGIEMVPVPLLESGPDMDIVEDIVSQDPGVKGIWCVPLYSNPEGVCYSDETVDRLVSMKAAAKDFSIFWDNAYGVHHIYEEVALKNIFEAAEKRGNKDRIYYFFSTSKISFPGSGIALLASSHDNIKEISKHISAQTIGHDKINQLRHLQKFKTAQVIKEHMILQANELRPKFDLVFYKLKSELGPNGFAQWSSPKGGYFVSLHTPPGCAKDTVMLSKNVGVLVTPAGATFPYGLDPEDSNIRIAPSYPPIEELGLAMDVLCLCLKLAVVNKLLGGGCLY